MPLPPLMQKGLSALLKVVKLTDPTSINQAVTTLEQHFTLSAHEIAEAYQNSYESALKAIIAGLGDSSILDSKVKQEFAARIVPDYLQPFVQVNLALQQSAFVPSSLAQFRSDTIVTCQTLITHKASLFQGDKSTLTQKDLAALITDNSALSITSLVLEQVRSHPPLDEQLLAFFQYNDLLGAAILFFLEEELRQNERFRATLAALERQGLWQDVREIKALLNQVMSRNDLSAQIKPRDEFTQHNSESLTLIRAAFAKLKQVPANHLQYSQLAIMGASVLSSTGALAEAEQSLIEAMDIAKNDADRALAAFDLFQVRLRNGELVQALRDLQAAIAINPSRYALHEVDKYPIERILGAGGMGVVFLCQHKLRKQRVVVKCFWEPRKGAAEQVFKEAFLMSEIAGEFVPTPLDYGYVDPLKQERAFFITEYIDGAIDGETWLAQRGKLDLADGLQVGLQIAKGLQAAHQASILHLDLKPANVLLKREKTSAVSVKIIDFGLAQVATSLRQEIIKQQRSRSGLSLLGKAVFGTLDYACPEQQGFTEYGKPSVQCDVFAFGKTVYRLLTGKQPRHNLRQRDLPNVPALYELLEDCVEEEPSNRPESAQHLVSRLEHIEAAQQIKPNGSETPHRSPSIAEEPSTETIDKNDYQTWFNKAYDLVESGRFEEGIAAYDKALQFKPDYHEAWNNRGNVLSDLGRYEEAIKSYDKALQFKPDDNEAWYNRGIALRQLGRYEEAIKSYDKALQFKPDDNEAWNNRGNALSDLGRYEEAIKSYDKALQFKPDDNEAWNNRGIALSDLGRYEEAIKSYDKALQIKPDYHEAWNNRGIALRQLGRYEEAIASYDKALQIKPDKHEAWYNRGIALSDLGRYEEAIKSYDKALQIKPDKHEAWYNRGIALRQLGRYEEAIKSYDKALQFKPDEELYLKNRKIAVNKLGK